MESFESIRILLAGNTYLYKLFKNIFGHEPSLEQLDILTSEMTKEVLNLFKFEYYKEYSQGIEQLEEFGLSFQKDKAAILNKVNNEYTRLLIGPGKLPAPPWESVYRSKERLLFQQNTLEVRKCYLKYNFLPAAYPHVADDHLALELDFMVQLSSMAEQACENEDFSQLQLMLREQRSFLTDHLLIWIPEFAVKIKESSTSYFYPGIAELLRNFLKIQLLAIQEVEDQLLIS